MANQTIRLDIEVDASKGTATLKQFAGEAEAATKKAGDAAKEGGKGFGQFATALDETVGKLKDLLTPVNLLGAGIGIGLVESLKHAQAATIEYADELTRLKGVTGASIEELGGLREAADKMGIGSSQLQRALLLMSSQIEAGGEALGRMGISVEDVNGKQKAELTLLFEVIDKLSGMTNKTEAAALAKKTFGRAVGDLLPLLLAGSDRIKELGQNGAEFAKEFGDDALVATRTFKGEIAEAGDSITRLQITITQDAMPALSVLVGAFTAVVDMARQIPAPIRHILEITTLLVAGMFILAATVKTAALAWAMLTALPGVAWLGSIATAVGSVVAAMNPWILILTGLGGLLYMAFTGQLGAITDRFTSFLSDLGSKIAGFASTLWDSFKMRGMTAPGTPGLSAADDARELHTAQARQQLTAESQAEVERNLALRQKRLEIDKEILAETLKYYQATQAPEQAQISTIKANLALKLQELEIKKELRKDLAAEYDKEATEARKAAAAQITAVEVTALKTIDAARAESLIAQIAASETGEAKIRDMARAETDEIDRQLTIQAESRKLSDAEIFQSEEKKRKITIKANEELRKLAIEQATQLSAIAQKEAETVLKAHENEIEHTIAGLDLEQVARQHAFDTFKISLAQFTAESIANTEAVKQAKLSSLKAQEDAARDNATRELALAEAKWVGIVGGEVELATKTKDIAADLQKKLEEITGQRVKTEDEADKRTLELRLQLAKQEGILYAQEAGLIDDLKRKREQSLQNIGTVLEEQARQAGDLSAAYQVGFAQAASSADDAFAAMKKSGADAYQSLKSGLSDFLYDVFTGAKNIGDVFVNLGKRILRSFTDVFAEIIAKQLAMSAGFSFAGLFGTVNTVAAGFEGAPNQAAQAVQQLGDSATGAASTLNSVAHGGSLVTMAFSAITQTIGMFASGIVAVLQFIGSIASGNAVSGVAALFGSGGGSLLGQLSSGLSSIFTAIGGGFNQIVSGLAGMLPNAGTLGPAFGGAAGALQSGMGFIAQAAPWIGAAYGLYQMFSGQLTPLSGALQGAAIGAMFGGPVGAGIGAVIGTIGGFFSGLFGAPDPHLGAEVGIRPTDVAALLAARQTTRSDAVNAGPTKFNSSIESGPFFGGIYKRHLHDPAMERDLIASEMINIFMATLQAAVKGLKQVSTQLPTELGAELARRIDATLAAGFKLDFGVSDEDAAQMFVDWLKGMQSEIATTLTSTILPSIDLAALGAGDAVKGFEALLASMSALGAITKAVSKDVDLSTVTLDTFASKSIEYFKQFAKDGETFIDTVKRITEAIQGILNFQAQLRTEIGSLTGDMSSAIATTINQISQAGDVLTNLADALTVAVESHGSPEEVLAAAQQFQQTIEAELSLVQHLQSQVTALNNAILSGLNLAVSLSQKIDTLRGTEQNIDAARAFSDQMIGLFLATNDVTMRIALFSSGLLAAAENLSLLTERMPTVIAGFNMIMDQIRAMTNPQEALGALKNLADGIEASLQADIAAVNRQTQAQINALNAQKSQIQQSLAAQKTALENQKTLEAKHFETQKQALQTALTLSQQWVSVLQSVKAQLVELFNLLAPTHPLTSLNEIRAQFQSAFAQFQAAPTTEGATQVQDLAKQVLDLAKQTPGYELPSAAFQGLAGEVQTALEAIQAFAAAQPSQEEIQAQIADLEQQQATTLSNIDQQISAFDVQQSAQLAAIDQQIQATSAAAQVQIAYFQDLAATGLELIRQQVLVETTTLAAQQAKAAAELQAILGDKTYEQFIASKQAEAADLLRGIDRTLQDYLGSIITNLFPGVGVPHMAEGGIVTRPTFALIGESGPEAVIPLRSGSSAHTQGQPATVNITFTYAGSARKDEWDRFLETVIDDARFGKLGKVISEKVKGS